MQVVATAKAQVVAQAKADCEELLVAIVQVRAYGLGSTRVRQDTCHACSPTQLCMVSQHVSF